MKGFCQLCIATVMFALTFVIAGWTGGVIAEGVSAWGCVGCMFAGALLLLVASGAVLLALTIAKRLMADPKTGQRASRIHPALVDHCVRIASRVLHIRRSGCRACLQRFIPVATRLPAFRLVTAAATYDRGLPLDSRHPPVNRLPLRLDTTAQRLMPALVVHITAR